MATHEYWQFAFVRELGAGTKSVPRLGYRSPLKVEVSNLPIGSIPFEDQTQTSVTGNHIRVSYSLPEDTEGYTLTGKIKVLRKPKEFPRGHLDSAADIVVNEDFSSNLMNIERDAYFLYLDHDVTDKKRVLYYTVFYEATDNQGNNHWLFSQISGIDRAFALTTEVSNFSNQIYDYFPKGIKIKDKAEGDLTLYRLCQVLGRPLDEIQERLNQYSEKRYLPLEVDAAFIPYIDHILGWPTNFELSELRRRNETVNAIDIWKAKGTNNAFELALQEITGWNVELHEGYRHVITTAMPEDYLDANTPPSGWEESTDGVWADLVNAMPFNGTPDLSTPSGYLPNSPNNPFRVIYDGSSWVNFFGVLIQLTNPLGNSPLLRDLAKEKIERLLPYLAIHYANFKVQVADIYTEKLSLNTSEIYDDDYLRDVDESGELIITETVSHASESGVLYTYPHTDPSQSANNVLWSPSVIGYVGRLFHNVLN